MVSFLNVSTYKTPLGGSWRSLEKDPLISCSEDLSWVADILELGREK